jgi:CRP-like cAMP-binding protein
MARILFPPSSGPEAGQRPMTGTHSSPLARKLSRFFALNDAELQIVHGLNTRIVSLPADKEVIREGDRPTDCNLLLDGIVCRYMTLTDGRRQIVAFHFPGDIFDAQSFLLNQMDHSILALTHCRIAMISHDMLRRVFDDYPRIALAVWKDSLIDAAIFRQWVTNVGRRDALARTAHLLCETYARMASVGLVTENSVPWPMTQVELADALGISAVHVNRTLQQLRKMGVASIERQRLTIHDWPRLKAIADFDSTYLHLGERSDNGAGVF